jgi:hypothetical protein
MTPKSAIQSLIVINPTTPPHPPINSNLSSWLLNLCVLIPPDDDLDDDIDLDYDGNDGMMTKSMDVDNVLISILSRVMTQYAACEPTSISIALPIKHLLLTILDRPKSSGLQVYKAGAKVSPSPQACPHASLIFLAQNFLASANA